MLLDIGTVARRTRLTPATLRYYEEIGLIESVARHGLRRQYGPEVLGRLSLVVWAKSAGFSLDDIKGLFGRDGRPTIDRADLHRRADAIAGRIAELETLSRLLRHVADCPAPSHMECPTFRRLLAEGPSAG